MRSVLKSLNRPAVLVLTLLVGMLLFEGSASVLLAQGGQDFIVTFRAGTAPAARGASVGRAGAGLRFDYSALNAAAVRIPNANALAALQNDPAVASIIPDRPVFALQSANAKGGNKPDKPGGGGGGGKSKEIISSGLARVGLPSAGSDGEGIGVAIIDSGIDWPNADLAPAAQFFDAFGGNCQDLNGHGTHVAGVVGAIQGNNLGTVGVAPKATLYCVRALDAEGDGSDATVLAGLNWVLDNHAALGIHVANLSLGRPGNLDDNSALRTAFQLLHAAGVVLTVAAGNDPNTEVIGQVPATYPEGLAIASSTAEAGRNRCRGFNGFVDADTASYFTTDGSFDPATGIGVTVSAPGEQKEDISRSCFLVAVGIESTNVGGGTTRKFGSSMAAPHVAGIVARLLQQGLLPVENIRAILRADAVGKGTAPLNSFSVAYTFDGEREGIAQAP